MVTLPWPVGALALAAALVVTALAIFATRSPAWLYVVIPIGVAIDINLLRRWSEEIVGPALRATRQPGLPRPTFKYGWRDDGPGTRIPAGE